MTSPSTPSERSVGMRLAGLLLARPRVTVAIVVLLVAVAGTVAAWGLRVRPGYTDLLDPSSPTQARYLALLREFGNVEALYVVVSAPDEATAAAFVDRFAPIAEGLVDVDGTRLASSVVAGVDPSWFGDRLPAYLSVAALDHLTGEEGPRSELRQLALDPSPARVLAAVRSGLAAARTRGGAADQLSGEAAAGLPALSRLLRSIGSAARGEPASIGSWMAGEVSVGAGSGLDARGHLRVGGDRLLVVIHPADIENDHVRMGRFLDAMKSSASSVRAGLRDGADVRLAFTGAPALLVDEMRAVGRDTTVGSMVSFVLVSLLFAVSFSSWRNVLFACLANASGLILTFGAAWLLVGYLNLFSSIFAAVLAGMGIDFSIHLLDDYESHRRAGLSARDALLATFRDVFPPTLLSAVTTAACFFTIMTSGFRGFSQLGLVSGVGVLLCLGTSFTLVPALLMAAETRSGGRASTPPAPPVPAWLLGLLRLPTLRATLAVAVGVTACAAALGGLPRLRFDSNLLTLQPEGTEAAALAGQEGEQALSTHRAFILRQSLGEVASLTARLAVLPTVGAIHSAADLLPPEAPGRGERLRRLADALGGMPIAVAPAASVDAGETAAQLAALVSELQEAQDLAFDSDQQGLVEALDGVLAAGRDAQEGLALAGASTGLTAFRDASAADLRRMTELLPGLAEQGLLPEDLPPGVRHQFVGRDGSLAVIVEPKHPAWDRADLTAFAAELRSVAPDATGPPVQIHDVTELMLTSVERAGVATFVVIVVIVALGLRSLVGTAIAVAPIVVGFGLMLGVMAWLHVPLNPANLIALPLLLGIGVDGGVQVAHRWLVLRDADAAIRQLGHPLLITSLTTVLGFLPLAFASHRGIRSLGLAACIGSLTMLFSTTAFLPAVLALVDRRTARRRAQG